MSDAIEQLAQMLSAESSAEFDSGYLWTSHTDADREHYRERAADLLRTLGLVAVDPALVERVREAERQFMRAAPPPIRIVNGQMDMDRFSADAAAQTDAHAEAIRGARLALADAVLAQLGGGR